MTVSKPNAGTLRGVSLASLANSDVDALIKVLPRMTYPALTEHEIARLDASDLMQFAAEVIGFCRHLRLADVPRKTFGR